MHTLLCLPTSVFYAQGVKANVFFFDRKTKGQGVRSLHLIIAWKHIDWCQAFVLTYLTLDSVFISKPFHTRVDSWAALPLYRVSGATLGRRATDLLEAAISSFR